MASHVQIALTVVPKPNPTKTITFDGAPQMAIRGDPFWSGEGNLDFNCGSCGYTLMKGMSAGQIRDVYLRCPKCRSYNAPAEPNQVH